MRYLIYLLLLTASATSSLAAPLVDPTRPAFNAAGGTGQTNKDKLQLNATHIGNGMRYAIIDGVKLREGEHHGDLYLRRVNHKSVEVTANGEQQTLQLNKIRVKAK